MLNSSQQLAISFERHQASSSGSNQAGGAGQSSPSLGFAYRRTPRSNAYIQPRGFGGGGGGVAGSGKKDGKGNAPMSSSARLLSEGALTPSAKSGILSPDAYLSGGVKRLNIPTDTEERRQRFSSSRPLIRGSAAATPSDARRSQADIGATASNGSGVEEAKGEAASTAAAAAAATAAVTGTSSEANGGGVSSSNGHRVEFAASSPDGSARRNTQGASPPPSTGGIGTDVRAAATGADESLLDGAPAGGRLFQGEGGAASSLAPKLYLEEYDTKPAMSELAAMGEDALRAVSGFVVSRQGYGSIAWKEPVDLRGVDIGKVVRARGRLLRLVCTFSRGLVRELIL